VTRRRRTTITIVIRIAAVLLVKNVAAGVAQSQSIDKAARLLLHKRFESINCQAYPQAVAFLLPGSIVASAATTPGFRKDRSASGACRERLEISVESKTE